MIYINLRLQIIKMSEQVKKTTTTTASNQLFDKGNYMWMVIGLAVIILGFLLMSGGRSSDPKVFNPKEVYSTTRITIAPLLIIAGFIIEIFAIMKKSKNN
jgi:cytochrome bd-type quinol oxidase subunit 2